MKTIGNIILILTITFTLQAQEKHYVLKLPVAKGDKVEVQCWIGKNSKGEVIFINDEVFVIKSKTNSFDSINLADVRRLVNLTDEVIYTDKEKNKPEIKRIVNDYASRYFVSPSGFGLKKGTGYVQNSMLLLNSVFVGVTDNISVGGGMFWIYPMYFSARVTGDFNEYLHLGAGYLVLNPMFGSSREIGQVGYITMTFGTKEANFGFNYGGNVKSVIKLPLYTINGFLKVSDNFAFVTESWIVNINRNESDQFNVYSLGGKYITPKSHSFDFSVAYIQNKATFFLAPYVAVSFPF